MKGIFTQTHKTLSEAIEPINEFCEKYEWVVSVQWGPLREMWYTDEDDSRNLLELFHEFDDEDPWWFKRGLLPAHAEAVVNDEDSYYLGFDAEHTPAEKIREQLTSGISPDRDLFNTIESMPCVWLMSHGGEFGAWEAYTTVPKIQFRLMDAWNGIPISSDRWDLRSRAIFPPLPNLE